MKPAPGLLLILTCSATLCAGESSFIHEWFAAEKAASSGNPRTAAGHYRLCFDKAVAAGNANYAYAAAGKTAHTIYRQGKPVEAATFSRKAYEALGDLRHPVADEETVIRSELLGFVERGHLTEGRIGLAWRTSRNLATLLRGGTPAIDADGVPLTVADLRNFPPRLFPSALRLIEREADYLDLTGNSREALDLLDSADAYIRTLLSLGENERFYAFKLRSRQIELLDFLGYKARAIEMLEQQLGEVEARGKPSSNLRPLILNQRINLLRHRSQWEGPSAELLAEARTAVGELQSISSLGGKSADRIIALMEIDLDEAGSAVETLAAGLAERNQRGDVFTALYFGRDHLQARTANGEIVPDPEFAALLHKARSQGNKRSEPTLYTNFARHLLAQGRTGEATVLLREALRLVRAFGRPLHQFPILGLLLDSAVESGDPAAIRALLDELQEVYASVEDPPPERLVMTALSRARALAVLGREAEARQLLADVREQARDLPAWQTRWLTPEIEGRLFANLEVIGRAADAEPTDVRISPIRIGSIAEPGSRAETRFTLQNLAASPARGSLHAAGPGVAFAGGTLTVDPAMPVTEVRTPLTLPSGAELTVPARTVIAGADAACEVSLSWNGSAAGSLWSVHWEDEAKQGTVLDASLLRGNPYRAMVLHHRVLLPAGVATGAFRLTSPTPLRIEYYDPETQTLLAVDTDGDGDFTEHGDWAPAASGAPAAVPLAFDSPPLIEIRLFEAAAPLPESLPLTLRAEIYRDGAWQLEAEDTLE